MQFVAIILLLLRVDQRLGPTGIGEWALWLAAGLTVVSAADYLSRWAASTLRRSAPATPE